MRLYHKFRADSGNKILSNGNQLSCIVEID